MKLPSHYTQVKTLQRGSLTRSPTNPISAPFFTSVRRLCSCLHLSHTHTLSHTLPSTVPLCYRRLCGATPAWTAYVPPRGAAAACSGSSSAAGCSRCCSAEGHTRQTMTTEGKTAITLQIKPVRKYREMHQQ